MYCSAFAFAVLPSAFSIGNCIVVCVHRQVVKHAWRTKEKGRGWNSGGTAHSPAVKSKDTLESPKGRNWGKQTHNHSETHNDSQTLLFRLGLWFRIHQHAAWQLKPPYSPTVAGGLALSSIAANFYAAAEAEAYGTLKCHVMPLENLQMGLSGNEKETPRIAMIMRTNDR